MEKPKLDTVTLPDGNRLTGCISDIMFRIVRQQLIYWDQDCLEHWFLPRVDTISCVYDIGANLGSLSVYFATRAKKAKVFSFEPVPVTFDLLKRNVEQNGLSDRVTVFNCALGAQESTVRMQVNEKSLDRSTISDTGSQEVALKRLDDLNLPPPDFVKIDVEGYELEVLKGMERTLRESSPVLWVEIFAHSKDMAETYQFLSSLGYLPIDCGASPANMLFIKQKLSAEEKLKRLFAFAVKLQQSAWADRKKAVQNTKDRYEKTRSWKITAPLRAIRGIFNFKGY